MRPNQQFVHLLNSSNKFTLFSTPSQPWTYVFVKFEGKGPHTLLTTNFRFTVEDTHPGFTVSNTVCWTAPDGSDALADFGTGSEVVGAAGGFYVPAAQTTIDMTLQSGPWTGAFATASFYWIGFRIFAGGPVDFVVQDGDSLYTNTYIYDGGWTISYSEPNIKMEYTL